MMQSNAFDASIIQEAARLLKEDPEISNSRMLQKLALSFGPEITRLVPVTRVERMLRRPAMLLLRGGGDAFLPRGASASSFGETGSENGARPRAAKGGPNPDAASPSPSQLGTHPAPAKGLSEAKVLKEVEDALMEAFSLGVHSMSRREVVDAFRALDQIRARLRKALTPGS